MSAPSDRPATAARRPTPWGVLIGAAIVFAIGSWLYLDVRREVREAEAEDARKAAAPRTARPKILGQDVIPQEEEPAPAASGSAAPPVAPSASASSSPSAAPSR
jgi:hypothetical protein